MKIAKQRRKEQQNLKRGFDFKSYFGYTLSIADLTHLSKSCTDIGAWLKMNCSKIVVFTWHINVKESYEYCACFICCISVCDMYQNKALQSELLQVCKRLREHEQAIQNFKKSNVLVFLHLPVFAENSSRLSVLCLMMRIGPVVIHICILLLSAVRGRRYCFQFVMMLYVSK